MIHCADLSSLFYRSLLSVNNAHGKFVSVLLGLIRRNNSHSERMLFVPHQPIALALVILDVVCAGFLCLATSFQVEFSSVTE